MMHDAEQPLAGGNATDDVVRLGDTVRKPWGPTTPAVHDFLRAMAAAGVDVPEPLGRDGRGRQILEYVPGVLALHSPPLAPADLVRVGALVRSIHEASVGFSPSTPPAWDPLIPAPGASAELLCHGDLAPWNLVIGERWVFIDWDGAGPSTRLWDLAYAAQSFTLNDPDVAPEAAAELLVAFLDGYGADDALRAQLPRTMAERAEAMLGLLRTSHENGREPWGSMYLSGHGAHWQAVADYVARHQAVWTQALTGTA